MQQRFSDQEMASFGFKKMNVQDFLNHSWIQNVVNMKPSSKINGADLINEKVRVSLKELLNVSSGD